MENDVIIFGDYISGIAKRPDLSNQPCALVCKENSFIISVLVGEKGEPFEIPFDIVEGCTYRQRVIVSENMIDKKGTTQMDRDILLWALVGPTGVMANHLPGVDKMFNNVNIGKVDYNNMFELVIEYRTPERNKRLVINTYEKPSKIVDFYNSIKK